MQRRFGRKKRRTGQAQAINQCGRELSAATLMFHHAVAERLGLNPTDHKCLDMLCQHENATAGDLADWSGLTTGAVTGVIDRLEKAGYVRREPHPADRRKVVVRPVTARVAQIGVLFQSLGKSMGELARGYSRDELATIQDFMTRAAEVARRETRKLRDL